MIEAAVKKACVGLTNVDEKLLSTEIKNATYEGISEKDLAESMLMTARTMVEKEPNYSYVTARLLLNNLENEVGAFLEIKERKDRSKMYAEALAKTVDKGIELDFLNEELKNYDLTKMGEAILSKKETFNSLTLAYKLFTTDTSLLLKKLGMNCLKSFSCVLQWVLP